MTSAEQSAISGGDGIGDGKPDHLDGIAAQWAVERPDLDVSPMGIIGRVKRLTSLFRKANEEVWARYGLDEGLFDVLAALRRAGPPYRLSPTELYDSLLITSGTMTHRLSRLAAEGLIERLPNPNDGRGMLVILTSRGRELIDDAVESFLEQAHEMLAVLSEGDRTEVARILRQLLRAFGDTGASAETGRASAQVD